MIREAVTNAGPLIVLAKLNRLPLLTELYSNVSVPLAVHDEVVRTGLRRGHEDAWVVEAFLKQVDWRPVPLGHVPAEIAESHLDSGEKAAIALALERGCLVLMDEEHGRSVARAQAVPVCGSLGVLVQSFRRRLISETELRLDFAEIRRRHDIWISPTLCDRVLARALQEQ